MYAATTDKTRHIAKSIGLHTVSYPKRRPHTNTNAVITIPCNMYISKLMLPKRTRARWLNNFEIMPLLSFDMANQYINKLNGIQNNGAKRIHEGNEQYGINVNAETDTIIIISIVDNILVDCRSIHCLKRMEKWAVYRRYAIIPIAKSIIRSGGNANMKSSIAELLQHDSMASANSIYIVNSAPNTLLRDIINCL